MKPSSKIIWETDDKQKVIGKILIANQIGIWADFNGSEIFFSQFYIQNNFKRFEFIEEQTIPPEVESYIKEHTESLTELVDNLQKLFTLTKTDAVFCIKKYIMEKL